MTIRDEELAAISGWTDDEIAQDGVRGAATLYAAAALEPLALIELVERLNELNQNKLLSIGAGQASNLLHEFWDQGYKRMTARRRAALLARVFGSPDGSGGEHAESNDAFGELWPGLVTSLAEGSPEATTQAAALRDNLAEHTDDATCAAATELRTTLGEIAEVLSDMELRSAYRADDMWQVVEGVRQEQGAGGPDVQRARTLAMAGAMILRRLPDLCDADADADAELVQAAHDWLAASSRAA